VCDLRPILFTPRGKSPPPSNTNRIGGWLGAELPAVCFKEEEISFRGVQSDNDFFVRSACAPSCRFCSHVAILHRDIVVKILSACFRYL